MMDLRNSLLGLLAATALAGCSSSPFGSSPFSSASNVDISFVNASQTWDLDKNSVITCEEWKQYATSELRQADGDGDGSLNAGEWSKLTSSDKLFEITGQSYFDQNGDGKVSPDEIASKPNPAFRMLDRNNDCQIAHDEKATVYSNARPKSKDTGAAPSGPPPGGSGGR